MNEFLKIIENSKNNSNQWKAYAEKLDIKEFYNYVVDLYEDYAYELDTDIDNIKIELTEIKVLEGV